MPCAAPVTKATCPLCVPIEVFITCIFQILMKLIDPSEPNGSDVSGRANIQQTEVNREIARAFDNLPNFGFCAGIIARIEQDALA